MRFRAGWFMALALLTSASAARGGDGWGGDFEAGRARAAREGKDLLVDFGGRDWCVACAWLRERVFDRPEFVARASPAFVLVEVDHPSRTTPPPEVQERDDRLRERYGVVQFPTVILALPDGRAYARTTYREAAATPEAYWGHLEALRARGGRLRAALERAEGLAGGPRAAALVDGLSEVDAGLVPRFFADPMAEVRALDPADSTGYLAFLDGRAAIDRFEAGLDVHGGPIDVAAFDTLIAGSRLRGEQRQEALILRAAGEVVAGDERRALATVSAALDAQPERTRFDRGDAIPLDARSIASARRRIAEAEAAPDGSAALLFALHRLFEVDLPDSHEAACGGTYRPAYRVREPLGDRLGRAMLAETAGLPKEERARVLARGLDGTVFNPHRGPIREVLDAIVAGVGRDAAAQLVTGEVNPRYIAKTYPEGPPPR